MCGAVPGAQFAALEALIHAVEEGTLPLKRVEDALARHRRVKERFLAPPRPASAGRRGAARGARAATSIRRSPPRWRGSPSAMRKPRALRPGDRVAVVAPASPFARDEFDAGVAELRALGFEPVYDDSVFARHGYVAGHAGTCAPRRSRAPGSDPSIAALVAARGGYGSVQLLPLLDRGGRSARDAKAFIGYSDNTSILAWLTLQCGIVVVSRPDDRRAASRGARPATIATRSRACLCAAEPAGEIAHPQLEVAARRRSRRACWSAGR